MPGASPPGAVSVVFSGVTEVARLWPGPGKPNSGEFGYIHHFTDDRPGKTVRYADNALITGTPSGKLAQI